MRFCSAPMGSKGTKKPHCSPAPRVCVTTHGGHSMGREREKHGEHPGSTVVQYVSEGERDMRRNLTGSVVDCGHREGPLHSCAHVNWRNGFLAMAEGHANKTVPPTKVVVEQGIETGSWSNEQGAAWNGVFHAEMWRLTHD